MTTDPRSEPNVQQAVPFFWVRDIDVSLRFYIDGLGFEMTKKWTPEGKVRWCWLEIGKASIMLQEFRKDGPHPGAPGGKLGEGVSICFQCVDALAVYRALTSRGIKAKRPFVGNHMWVTSVVDPDGYHLEFESRTDVPEESVLEE